MTPRSGSTEEQNVAVDHSELLESVLTDVAAVAEVLGGWAGADVSSCPGWSVADLVDHHGGVLRWAARIVQTGEPVAQKFTGPREPSELADWYFASAADFVNVARTAGPDRACWTFGRPPAEAWFWTRRQALEAAIHRWDAELACGSAGDFSTGIASAGVAEVVDYLFPRQVALGRTSELSAAVSLRATDTNARWILGPERSHEPSGAVEAPAAVLMLLLWGRATLDDRRVNYSGPTLLREEISTARFTP